MVKTIVEGFTARPGFSLARRAVTRVLPGERFATDGGVVLSAEEIGDEVAVHFGLDAAPLPRITLEFEDLDAIQSLRFQKELEQRGRDGIAMRRIEVEAVGRDEHVAGVRGFEDQHAARE